MNRLKYILLFAIWTVLVSSCAKDNNLNELGYKKDSRLTNNNTEEIERNTFKVKISASIKDDVNLNSIKATFLPSSELISYLPIVVKKEELLAEDVDAKVLATKKIREMAESEGISSEEYIKKHLLKGEQKVLFTSLEKTTIYTFLLFQLNEKNELVKECYDERFFFQTTQVKITDESYNISHKEEGENIEVKVQPENAEKGYWVLIFTEAERIVLNDMFKQDDASIITANMRKALENARKKAESLGEKVDNKKLMELLLKKGPYSITRKVVINNENGLNNNDVFLQNLDYVVLVAGFTLSDDGKKPIINTRVKAYNFLTPKKEVKLPTINFLNEITEGSKPGKIKAKRGFSDKSIWYVWETRAYNHETKYMSDMELAENIIEELKKDGYPMFSGSVPPWSRRQGIYEKEYNNPSPGKECYSIIFALDEKFEKPASKPIIVKFKFGEKPDISDVTYKAKKTQKGTYGIKISIEASKKNSCFAYELQKEGTLTAEQAKQAFIEKTKKDYADWKWRQNGPAISLSDFVQAKYLRDKLDENVLNLTPGTTYDLFIYTIDPDNGEIIKVDATPKFANTEAINENLSISYEVYGVFDGDEVDNKVIDENAVPSYNSRGKAVVVVKYILDKARFGWAYVMPQTASKVEYDPVATPDLFIFQKVGLAANKIDRFRLYRKYYCDWDDPLVIMTTGIDSNEDLGRIKRTPFITPMKKDKSDIKKLADIAHQLIEYPDYNY